MERVVLFIGIKHGFANCVVFQLYLWFLLQLLKSNEIYVASGSAPPPHTHTVKNSGCALYSIPGAQYAVSDALSVASHLPSPKSRCVM